MTHRGKCAAYCDGTVIPHPSPLPWGEEKNLLAFNVLNDLNGLNSLNQTNKEEHHGRDEKPHQGS